MKDRKQYMKEYREKNKDKIAAQLKDYNEKNAEKIAEYQRNYQKENKEKFTEYNRDYQSNRRKVDEEYRVGLTLRSRLYSAVKFQGARKSKKTMELIGCDIKELIAHIESQFTEGMTWENHGYYGWHIDHIKPCTRFNLLLDTEQRDCFNYSNLQPLWASDNLSKSDKYNET
jgi:hypothetical protein|tara:strand:+ start:76 stop:591 length:516 start_codon:yes stop_codon:yes gene_type:complete